MVLVLLPAFHVYICFNYYAGNGRDGNIFRHAIVSVFSRMNQIRFAEPGISKPKTHRRPLRLAPGPYAGWIDSRSFSHGSRAAYASKRRSSVETRMPPGGRRSALLKFETPVQPAVRQRAAGRIRPSNHGIAS